MENFVHQRGARLLAGAALAVAALANWGCSSKNDDAGPSAFEGTNSGISFQPGRGFYASPLDVTLSHARATEVRYTLDSSDPRTSTSAITAPLPLVIRVDPSDTNHRYLAPGVIIRASVGGSDVTPDMVATHSYLFPGRVVELSPDGLSPGGDWPEPLAPANATAQQAMDYGMDREVVNSPDYADQMDAALMALPSLSLVTDLANLFDAGSGIYANADGDGVEWERFGSIEELNPDKTPGFQSNAGIRIRGAHSRKTQNPKHSFRLFFKSDYGTTKLRFPLFGGEGTNEFDKLDIRTAQNYSWSEDSGDNSSRMTMTRDVFSRDLQGELGRPYTRSRACHLYLDGVYWGLYQTEERPEANFAKSYWGGKSDDYDTIKVERSSGRSDVEATDGDLAAWNAVWEMCKTGFVDDDAYYRLEGRSAAGTRDRALPVLVDVDNLIDYMLIIFHTANYDAPISKFFSNNQANNFFAVRNHVAQDKGFVFFLHDSEHSLMADKVAATMGIDEDRVNIGVQGGATDRNGAPSEAFRMNVTDSRQFNPQWLHFKLTENAQYRTRFAARAHALLDGDGKFNQASLTALHRKRVDEILVAIVAESARWGDSRHSPARTKNADFLPAVARIEEGYLANRVPVTIAQLTKAGLY